MQKEDALEYIKTLKNELSTDEVCSGLPKQFSTYLNYCRNLKFKEKPDYSYLRGLFRDVFEDEDYLDDGVYD